MSSEKIASEVKVEAVEPAWAGLYRTAGVCALIGVAFVLLDIALSFIGGDVPTGTLGAVEWFNSFQENAFMGLRNFGLFNVINTTLAIPLYLALYRLHRGAAPAFGLLALILVLLGAAIYDANNRALTMLSLSQQYAQAAGAAQKALLAAAGTAVLAQAEDFTPGTFLGFFFSSAGSLMMMAVMLRGGLFRRWVALAGLVGTGLLLVFTIVVTFVPAAFQVMMLLAMAGGLVMLAWNIRMAIEMFGLGRAASERTASERTASQRTAATSAAPLRATGRMQP